METSVRASFRLPRLDFARTDPSFRRAGSRVPRAQVAAPVVRSRPVSAFPHPLWRGGAGARAQNGCGVMASPRVARVVRSRAGSVFSHRLWRGGVGAGAQNGGGNLGVRRGSDASSSGGLRRSAAGCQWSSSRHVMSRGAIPGWVFRGPSGRPLRPGSGAGFRYRPSGDDSPTDYAAAMVKAGRPGLGGGCRCVAKSRVPLLSRAQCDLSMTGIFDMPRSAAEPTRPA